MTPPTAPKMAPKVTTARDEFLLGLRDEAPLQVGIIPFGMIFGVLGITAGLTPLQTLMISVIVFGGAGQIVFIQLVGANAGLTVTTGTIGIINLRHLLYSASVASHLGHLSMRWKILLSYLLTDEAYAISIKRFEEKPPSPDMHYHLLGTSLLLWGVWQCATIAGIVLGAAIPPSLGLEFAIPLTFLAIIINHILKTPHQIAMIVSAIVAVSAYNMPWKLNIFIAACAGMAAGFAAEKMLAKNTSRNNPQKPKRRKS